MKFKNYSSTRAGFTLVELMIVISIIAILTGIIMTSLLSSKAKSRDAQRVSDLNQIQVALEQYFNQCGVYPAPGSGALIDSTSVTCGGSSVNINSYISKIPDDPTDSGQYVYSYVVNNTTTPTDYVLHATLEEPNTAPQKNSYPNKVWTDFKSYNAGTNSGLPSVSWNCYDGTHANDYCISTK